MTEFQRNLFSTKQVLLEPYFKRNLSQRMFNVSQRTVFVRDFEQLISVCTLCMYFVYVICVLCVCAEYLNIFSFITLPART